MIVKYVSGVNGKTFTLNKGYDLAIKECNPHTSAWTYESVSQQFGEKITSFGKEILEMDIRLKFRGTLDGIFLLTRPLRGATATYSIRIYRTSYIQEADSKIITKYAIKLNMLHDSGITSRRTSLDYTHHSTFAYYAH